jgi:hypothetical protein
LQQGLLAAGIARPFDPAQGGLLEFGGLGALLQRTVIESERRPFVPIGKGRDTAQQRQGQVTGAHCGRADQPAGLDEAQRARQRYLDAPGRGPDWRRGERLDRQQIERPAVGSEPAQSRFDHRLPGKAGMLDGPPDQGQTKPRLTAFGHETAAVPGRGQHKRVRHPVIAGENSALAAGRGLEQIGIDAPRLERATRAGGKPGDADPGHCGARSRCARPSPYSPAGASAAALGSENRGLQLREGTLLVSVGRRSEASLFFGHEETENISGKLAARDDLVFRSSLA